MRFQIVLPFDTDDPEFTRGVEVGLLWARLAERPEAQSLNLHVANAEMALRIAETTGRRLRTEEPGDGWLLCHFSEAGA